MDKAKIKFAIVGCGRISGKHIEVITRHLKEQATLIAVCDQIADKAKIVGEKNNIPYYYNYDDMLSKHPEIDVVNILTESGNHAKNSIDIIEKYKKHIVVEKPMALTLQDADLMIEKCDYNNVKLFVVKQNRYNLPVMALREALINDRFGKVVMGSVRVRWCRKQDYYDQDKWRGTWAMDGGVFTNQASHHIDLLEWMLGEPISVFAKSRTALARIEVEDTGVAIVKFKNGALGIIEATTATRPKDIEGSLSILGERGSVEIAGFAVNEIRTWNFAKPEKTDSQIINNHKENPSNVYGYGHIKYLENVCEAILHKRQGLVEGLEGRKSLELINAIYESIETGREVFLKFQPKQCKLGNPSVIGRL